MANDKKTKKKACPHCSGEYVDLKKHVANIHEGYELNIKAGDSDYTAHTSTLREALENFVDSGELPFGAKTVAVFTIKKDDKKAVLRLNPLRARRLFLQFPQKSTALDVFAGTLERRLNESSN